MMCKIEDRIEECVYVGDMKNDMDAAVVARIKFILFSKEKVDGADVMTADFWELPSLIKDL